MARYYYLNRPGSIGCQPDGYSDMDSGLPKRIEGDIDCFGWVEYPERLEVSQVWKYDLLPAEQEEQLLYRLWLHQGRDWDAVANWLWACQKHWDLAREQREPEYRWAVTLLESGVQPEDVM